MQCKATTEYSIMEQRLENIQAWKKDCPYICGFTCFVFFFVVLNDSKCRSEARRIIHKTLQINQFAHERKKNAHVS